ncbi:MAG TPA: hypothetical protein DCG50_06125, partial [Elusimicrobia bacterium]|nr:hypothetical protein [Elusimicrobiota bacterium]
MRALNSCEIAFKKTVGGFLLSCAIILCLAAAAKAAAVTTAISSGTSQQGGTGWTTPAYILQNDSVLAIAPAGSAQSDIATAFGFAIPTDAVVQGITVYIAGFRENGGSGNFTVSLTKNGSAAATAAYAQSFPGTAKTTLSTGAASDLWGTTWQPSELNASTFGIMVLTADTKKVVSFDWVGISVTYLPAPGSPAVSAVYSSSAAVTWTQVGSENGYVLQASTASNFTGTISSSQTTSGTSTGLTVFSPALTGNTTYTIRAGSLWNNGTTSYAAVLTTCTLANAPAFDSFTGMSTGSVKLNWGANGNRYPGTRYHVLVSTAPNPESPNGAAVTSSDTYNLSLSSAGLAANSTYYFR